MGREGNLGGSGRLPMGQDRIGQTHPENIFSGYNLLTDAQKEFLDDFIANGIDVTGDIVGNIITLLQVKKITKANYVTFNPHKIFQVQVTDTADGDYTVTINGNDYTFTASDNTLQEIRDGIIEAILLITTPEPVTITTVDDTNGDTFYISNQDSLVDYTLTVGTGLSATETPDIYEITEDNFILMVNSVYADAQVNLPPIATATQVLFITKSHPGGSVNISSVSGEYIGASLPGMSLTGYFDYIGLGPGTTNQWAILSRGLDIGPPEHTHATLPTQDEKDALAGTDGSPSDTNRYVTDSDPRLVSSLTTKNACKYATATDLPTYIYNNGTSGVGATITGFAFGELTVDGNTPSIGDRILYKDGTGGNNPYNGIYVVTDVGSIASVFILTRSTDMDQDAEIEGALVAVEEGDTLAHSLWLIGAGPFTIGTTDINFNQINSPLSAHATTHENGGSDEINVAGLSGLLADSQTPLAHKTSHENGGGDEISVAGLSGLLADGQTPLAHKTSHQDGGSDEISVAGLSGLLADSQTPLAHKTSHQDGGSDEISVTGLSGLLADGQTPLAHKTSHQDSGSDEISVTGLSGLLADGQTPLAHATSHQPNGSDEIFATVAKKPCVVATTAALPANTYNNGTAGVGATLTANVNGAIPSQDGQGMNTGDRILVWFEATSQNNGIYTVTNLGSAGTKWVLTRATDADTPIKLMADIPGQAYSGGVLVPIIGGTIYRRSVFIMRLIGNALTFGSDAITFWRVSVPVGTSAQIVQFDSSGNTVVNTMSGGATISATGVVTLTRASTTEVLIGTDTDKAVTPDSLAALWEQGADVASAGTISLGEGGYFVVTGTTGITDIDFATDKAGRYAVIKFAGILTLTHSSTLILPTSANITTAAGDTALFISEGSDVVRCIYYQRATGQPITTVALAQGGTGQITGYAAQDALSIHGADVASSGTTNLDTATGNLVDVTGTTTITAITLAEGRERTVRFTGILTLTHGSSLVLPTAANITTAAGDFAIFKGYAAGVVRCISYQRADGKNLATLQHALDSTTAHSTPTDTTDFNVSSAAHGLAPKGANLSLANIVFIGQRKNVSQTAAITRSGTTATFTATGHGLANGDWVKIISATQTDYNIWAQISNVTANTFDYTVANNPTTPSTGTAIIRFWANGARSLNMNLISTIVTNGTGDYSVTFVNTQANAFYGYYGMAAHGGSGGATFSIPGTSAPTTTVFRMLCVDTGGIAAEASTRLIFYLIGMT